MNQEQKESKAPKGRISVYTCGAEDHKLVTIEREEGVTPFVIPCQECNSEMLHRHDDENAIPTHEWFKPRSGKFDKATYEHIQKGGLILRKITEETEEYWRSLDLHNKQMALKKEIDEAIVEKSAVLGFKITAENQSVRIDVEHTDDFTLAAAFGEVRKHIQYLVNKGVEGKKNKQKVFSSGEWEQIKSAQQICEKIGKEVMLSCYNTLKAQWYQEKYLKKEEPKNQDVQSESQVK
jgi:hypothetical protein